MAGKILIQMKDGAGNTLYPEITGDCVPDGGIATDKLADNAVTEKKLATELSSEIANSKTVTDTLLEGLKDPDHLEDPFVRAGIIPIPFEDEEVKKILVASYDTDGDGEVYYDDVKGVTTFPAIFGNNTEIRKFRELRFFDGVTTIARAAFEGCAKLAEMEMPEALEVIDSLAFHGCTALAVEWLPDSVVTIGEYAFEGCTSLALTKLPDSLRVEGITGSRGAFKDCTSLALTKLPDGIIDWQSDIFRNCTNLALTELPGKLKNIYDDGMFNNMQHTALTKLPDSLESTSGVLCTNWYGKVPGIRIDYGNFTKGTTALTYADGTLYDAKKNELMLTDGHVEKVTVPEGITAFKGRAQSYGGEIATKVYDLPSTITSWPSYVFVYQYANNSVYGSIVVVLRAATPPAAGGGYWNDGIQRFYVPDDSVEAYKAATAWNEVAGKIYPLSEYKDSDWITS